ncbi:integrase core domain protein [Oesophagostomum dentatum]|uniref:RNA-directed DNA polymerase n=1 Tax=Oesophagostomum dentatum TaxID=61180 RepID=A0A0B1TRC4_OESDE|nr:integrase core domain protein [Oesophagostomum dentatum]
MDPSYEVILGNDILVLLPLMTIDFAKQNVHFGTTTLNLANSEIFVSCVVQNACCNKDFVLVSQCAKLASKDLIVAPALINSQSPCLLISNPTNQAATLYEGMRVAEAEEISEDGTIISKAPSKASGSCVTETFAEDPRNKIDLQNCDLSASERAQLQKLLDEYSDVFQNTSMTSCGETQQAAFVELRDALLQKPILGYPNYEKPFHIFTDASSVAQAGALMQEHDSGPNRFYAMAYCSRTLSETERRWSAVQIELGAFVYALRQFKPYVCMSKVVLHSDHKPLSFLLNKSKTHDNLARWLIELQGYDLKVVHIKGEKNTVADALSHTCEDKNDINPSQTELKDIIEFPVSLATSTNTDFYSLPTAPFPRRSFIRGMSHSVDMAQEQQKDNLLKMIYYIKNNLPVSPTVSEKDKAEAIDLANKVIIKSDGCLYYEANQNKSNGPLLLVPRSLRTLVFDAHHSSALSDGHMNWRKTLAKILRKYYWSVPLEDARANTIAHALLVECVLKYGAMAEMVTDNASSFTSAFYQEFCNLLHIQHKFATPYHSMGNGATERTVRTFQDMLSKFINIKQEDWDSFLPCVAFCYNTTINDATNELPYFLMFGRDPIFAVDQILLPQTLTHIPGPDETSEYKAQLVSALHLAWNNAAEYARKAKDKMKA